MLAGNEIYDNKIKEVNQLFIYTHEEMGDVKEKSYNAGAKHGTVAGIIIGAGSLLLILLLLEKWHPEIVKQILFLK